MKQILTLTFTCLLFMSLQAQQPVFSGRAVGYRNAPELTTRFRDYRVFDLPTGEIYGHLQSRAYDEPVRLDLEGYQSWSLELRQEDLLAKDYKAVVAGPNGRSVYGRPDCMTFGGQVTGMEKSNIRLTVAEGFVYGYIKTSSETYFVEPLRYFNADAPVDQFVVYKVSDVIFDGSATCAVTEMREKKPRIDPDAGKISERNTGTACKHAQLAIASDYGMLTRYGSVTAVQTHNIGVINNVQGDYRNNDNMDINDNIEFIIVTQYVSNGVSADPLTPSYTGTEAGTILSYFMTWGNNGGFGSGITYDLASLWVTRDIASGGSNGTIGIAYVDAVCDAFRYHVLEDYLGSNPTGNGWGLRVLTSHEMGHNFSCGHDGSGTSFIMAPSVNNTSDWSSASESAFTAALPTYGCLSNCSQAGPPVIDFTMPGMVCVGSSVNFRDASTNGPSTWNWTFSGGAPASSSLRNPIVNFYTSGLKTITLDASNASGSGTTKTKTLLVSDGPATACTNSGSSSSTGGIFNFSLNNISKSSGSAAADGNKYMDFSCSSTTVLSTGTTYQVSTTIGNCSASIFHAVRLYLDANNDGDFTDAGEQLYTTGGTGWCGTITYNITTPSAPLTNTLLRLRQVAEFGSNSCSDTPTGQVEDYGVYFLGPLPVALSSLEARFIQNRVRLDWSTASESNNAGFDVERSLDGKNFTKIGFVQGAGNAFEERQYTYDDFEVVKEKAKLVYYRLRQVGSDDSYDYSGVVSVRIYQTSNSVVALYPNPTNDKLFVELGDDIPEDFTLALYDINGRNVARFDGAKGTYQKVQLDMAALLPGTYVFKLLSGNQLLYTERVVKM